MSDAELSPDEVRHVARLARIALEDAEVEAQRAQLARILGHMAELDAVDVEGVEPTFHAVTEAPLRRDEVRPAEASREALLEAAPREVEGGFAVPQVMEGDT
ncbi:MAG TPA: Asp-tRNA(Asn)/Glu-tRNA(Gln) amidotransferase subunit GatC [Polyangiaceae bacterium LLY-WYZ-15_(1-7)]|nr:Asp-tRNA(Asn)/Glu-tRNA(Gln) amidotransferase GatCAB subunit C [Myxococcales bacterium]MAT24783.1 Asp-tRNA(Asn)/Glu-tRNA(Gln) amidotransferase GatCAB subunit C [Sandaracinus sp.]HJL02436.1 Asp-tRNA(Asn)/Glu-tRNA(Gln) amidotransferase subunit GatC [Polyangiaceae bacterium LLY-WYZ-15_(1-7)]HJL11726.1 Asp-tRNA(Asn)/Glu-tRNA(Gln) amidotransferase subunit GatC [Polyangiaceae bacterium LLY-WYZ-15_(1-7)]HJL25395.1 Asp-tRNA(Asn)/Glu-tRNA(Gln) amidotransferase subunit GatC [Polyangiaceae bacterium LLY